MKSILAVSALLFSSLHSVVAAESDPWSKTVVVNGVEVEKKTWEIRDSAALNKTLIRDYASGTKLTYQFYTSLEEYNDGSSHSFLVSSITLHDVNTFAMTDTSSIRATVGWRNHQEDAYDFSGIEWTYNPDYKQVKVKCTDGYGRGNVDTVYYDKKKGVDANGKHNITVEQWTNFKVAQGDLVYRKEESQECEVKSHSVSPRLDFGADAIPGISPLEVKQTFTVQIRKPFYAKELSDVHLLPLQKYNLTSAYGCYQLGKKGDEGVDGSVHFQKDKKLKVEFGCQFKWQAEQGNVVHKIFDKKAKGDVSTITEGLAEKQISVMLLERARGLGVAMVISVVLGVMEMV